MTKRRLVSFFFVAGLALAPAASRASEALTGKVTDLDGRPVAGLPLWAIPASEPHKDGLPPLALTGADGSFSISGLPPGAVELSACGSGYVQQSRTVWFRDRPVHLKLQPAATLRGRVLGPDGAPVAGVRLYPRETPAILTDHGMIVSLFPDVSPPCPDTRSTSSGADGRFELGSLLPGRYEIEISADGLKTEDRHPMRLSGGEVVEGLEIRLRSDGSAAEPRAQPGVLVSGKMLDSTGKPVAGGEVAALQDDEVVDHVGTRNDGSFALHLPQGDVQLLAAGVEIPEQRLVDISVGRQPVRDLVIRLEPETSIRVTGRVLGLAPGQEAEIVAVLNDPDREDFARALFEGDRYTLSIEPGSWVLQGVLYNAAGTYLRSVRWGVDIPNGTTKKTLDLDLARAEVMPEEEP